MQHLDYLQDSQYFSLERIREIQFEKIKQLLDHSYAHCTHYRKKFDEIGLHPKDIKSMDDFRRAPVLTKDEVRSDPDDLVAPNIQKYTMALTSGSTGKPLTRYRDWESNELMRAAGKRSDLWTGYDIGERIYVLYGNPLQEMRGFNKLRSYVRSKILNRVEVLNLLRLNDEAMIRFADMMRRKPPALLWGHAHALHLLAKFFDENGIRDIQPKGMYSAGMVLHDWEREKVQQVFNCKLQDRYGCEELGLIAAECKEMKGLHINIDCLYVEFLDKDGNPVAPGEPGRIVLTDLTNKVMPFIRYDLEDICIHSSEQCPCGRTQPLIKRIEGRVADFLITPEGALVSGISLTDHFAGHIPGVAQMQIVQEEMDMLSLVIVKDGYYGDKSEEAIARLVREFFGEKMRYRCDFVKMIEAGRSGKYRFTVCKVNHGLL